MQLKLSLEIHDLRTLVVCSYMKKVITNFKLYVVTLIFSRAVVAVIIQQSFGLETGQETVPVIVDTTMAFKVCFIPIMENDAVCSLLSSV